MSSYAQPPEFQLHGSAAQGLLPTGVRGHEGISELYEFTITFVAPLDAPAKFTEIMGSELAVELALPERPTRFFSGLVAEFVSIGRDKEFRHYRAVIRPQFWLLTRTRQCRIYQRKTVPEILREILGPLRVSVQLVDAYPIHNYCVQYEESDFAFACRLMEEEGIYYYFEHRADGSVMILSDNSTAGPQAPGASQLRYDPVLGGTRPDARVQRWRREQRLRGSKVVLWDHSFELPGQSLEASVTTLPQLRVGTLAHPLTTRANAACELYEGLAGYAHRFDSITPGGGNDPSELEHLYVDNQRLAKIRLEQELVDAVIAVGRTNCPSLCPGFSFTLTNHDDADDAYLVTRAEHRVAIGAYRSDTQTREYRNKITCIPKSQPYRPKRVTRRPQIKGLQAATVVGVEGDDISTDDFGRVKVQFTWDRFGTNDLRSSCWLRVITLSAGKGFGMTIIPRIGMEVLVSFINGDPDCPIVVGCVTNPMHMPHHELPIDRQISGLRSHTIRGGADNYSEITIEDLPGKEYVNIHSERDYYLQSEKTSVVNVGTSWFVTVGIEQPSLLGPAEGKEPPPTGDHRYSATIHGYFEESVSRYASYAIGHEAPTTLPIEGSSYGAGDGDHSITITGNRSLFTAKNEIETTRQTKTTVIYGNVEKRIESGSSLTTLVTGNETRTIQLNHEMTVQGNQDVTVQGNHATVVLGTYELDVTEPAWTVNRGISQDVFIGLHEEVSLAEVNEQTVGLKTEIMVGGSIEFFVGISVEIGLSVTIDMKMDVSLEVDAEPDIEQKTMTIEDVPVRMRTFASEMKSGAAENKTAGVSLTDGCKIVV